MNELERFWSKVDIRGPDECWPWLASCHGIKKSYGQFNIGKPEGGTRMINAHRLAYILVSGRDVPDSLEVDHLCRNRICMNFGHLEPVPKIENILRGNSPMAQQARVTTCIRGHAFDVENTFWYGPKKNHRRCKKCEAIRKKQARNSRRPSFVN